VIPDQPVTGHITDDRRRGSGRRVQPPDTQKVREAGEICPELWSALELAGDEVRHEWQVLSRDAVSAEEVGGHITALLAAVRALVEGSETTVPALPKTPLARRVLQLLRRRLLALVAGLEPIPEASQILGLLRGIETLQTRIEADWSQHLAERLAGPDGLELVVEVAHDLRSPLTSILFLAETLQRGRSGSVTEIQERQLGLIYSAAFGLSAMASDVMELARGGDRLVDLDPIPFSIADILESVRDIVQPIAEEKGLTVRIASPDDDFRVGHPVALSRVLLNLTTNALKFTDEGFVEVHAVARNDTTVEYSVRDTGRGIPPHAMRTLFEPFRRRQQPGNYAFSGSGLGLSICRKLVEAMGSELLVDTVLGEGTRFYFSLVLPYAEHSPPA
jgi:signal transduction histidine kinase